MRLYNTLTRQLEELPPPPGPVRMYFCGPTVYQRAHIGNARPFVARDVAARVAARARLRRDARPQHHRRQRQDLRRRAGRERRARRARDRSGTSRTPATSASACRTRCRRRPRRDPGDRPLHRAARRRAATRTRSRATSTSASRAIPGYGRLSGQRPDQVEEQEPNPLKEDPRDFALWKANKPGEDTSWDSPWGRGRPGWHIECSAMAEERSGRRSRSTAAGSTSSSRTTRTSSRSRARSATSSRGSGCTTGCSTFAGEKMSKSLGNDVSIRDVLDTWGREVVLLFFLTAHWRKPIDFSDETLEQAKAQVETLPQRLPRRRADARAATGTTFAAALDDDFNTPEALALLHDWRDARRSVAAPRRSTSSGSARSPSRRRRRPRSSRSPSSGAGARRRRTSPRPTACATRSQPPAGSVRDDAGGFRLVRARDAASSSTGAARSARRCAGGARCSSCGRPSARCKSEAWLREASGRACR